MMLLEISLQEEEKLGKKLINQYSRVIERQK